MKNYSISFIFIFSFFIVALGDSWRHQPPLLPTAYCLLPTAFFQQSFAICSDDKNSGMFFVLYTIRL